MATHSSVLAWRIPGWRSLVGCRLWGCTESDTAEAAAEAAANREKVTSPSKVVFLREKETHI